MKLQISNKDLLTKESIFYTIREIESIFESKIGTLTGTIENVTSVIFEENIKFVNPLFLILLLNSHSKYPKHALAINTTFLSDVTQIFIHRFLIQFYDYLYIEPNGTKLKRRTNINDESIAKSAKIRTDVGKRGILYYYSQVIYKNLESLSLDEDKKYAMLPIMSISNVIDKNQLGYTTTAQDDRIRLYNKIALDNDKKNLQDILNTLLKQLHEKDKKNIFYIDSLSMILFEIIDNIKRHTKYDDETSANGYISFHQNRSQEETLYELTLSDDYEDGFLNRYKIVLVDELKRQKNDLELIGKELDENVENSYIDDIEFLNSDTKDGDINILKKLFDINETFGMHQIPRMTMHFGIPSLIKLLRKLDGNLSIFLHRNDRYYKITFKDNKTDVVQLDKQGINGTYYHIEFPEYNELEEDKSEITKLTLKTTNYKELFDNKDKIEEQIKQFKYIRYKELNNT